MLFVFDITRQVKGEGGWQPHPGKDVNLVHSIGEEGDLVKPSQEREGRQSIEYKERMNYIGRGDRQKKGRGDLS